MGAKTKLVGDIGVSAVIQRCVLNNVNVSIPFGDNCSYDLIIDVNNKLYRVQVKTTQRVHEDGRMLFATNKTNPYRLTKTSYTNDEIDLMILYCIENEYMGIIDMRKNDCPAQIAIRTVKSLNNQRKNIRLAEDYEFSKVLLKL